MASYIEDGKNCIFIVSLGGLDINTHFYQSSVTTCWAGPHACCCTRSIHHQERL